MKLEKTKLIGCIVVWLILLQLILFGIEQSIFIFVNRTDYIDHMASMFAMIIITIFFVLFVRSKSISLSIYPKNNKRNYAIATIIVLLLLIVTPSNFTGGFQAITLLIYSSIVTPIFEELIFRGYVWNKLNTMFAKEWKTYIVTTILFALWHIGYISAIAFRVETGLANVMMWKVIVGLFFGIILGAVRLKTKNSYSTILLHGAMNIFGR